MENISPLMPCKIETCVNNFNAAVYITEISIWRVEGKGKANPWHICVSEQVEALRVSSGLIMACGSQGTRNEVLLLPLVGRELIN